jgi:hypothetical protein
MNRSCRSVLLVEEIGMEYPQKTTDLSQVTSPGVGFELTMLVVMDTDCIYSYKSNYHTITTTTAPKGSRTL